jgi:hypothetical protein
MKQLAILILTAVLFGAGSVVAQAEQGPPPRDTNQRGQKRTPGPLVKEDKRGRGDRGGERPPDRRGGGGERNRDRPPRPRP